MFGGKVVEIKKLQTYLKVDVDEQDDVVTDYDIKVMPTFVFIKDGQRQNILEGNNFEQLRKDMSSYK